MQRSSSCALRCAAVNWTLRVAEYPASSWSDGLSSLSAASVGGNVDSSHSRGHATRAILQSRVNSTAADVAGTAMLPTHTW